MPQTRQKGRQPPIGNQKFSGIIKEIVSRDPNIDVADFLEFELGIPRFKAEVLAKRIEEKYLQNFEKSESTVRCLFEKQDEETPKVDSFNVSCLSEKEFKTLICWVLKESGYMLQPEKTAKKWGFEGVAEKGNEKIFIQALRTPRGYVVSELFIPLSEAAQQKCGCSKSIMIAPEGFSRNAAERARQLGIELWGHAVLNQKIVQAKKNCEVQAQAFFPPYQGSLFDSLLKLEESREFLIELKAEWRYELLLPGVKYPLLTFQVRNGAVTRCVFRIKYNEPVTELEGEVVISADEAGNRVGPSEAQAYEQVIQYLEQFLE